MYLVMFVLVSISIHPFRVDIGYLLLKLNSIPASLIVVSPCTSLASVWTYSRSSTPR